MTPRWMRPGDAWGAAPLSRRNEPTPAIPAARRQTVDTRAGFRVKAATSRNCTLNPCFPAIITGLRGAFSERGDTPEATPVPSRRRRERRYGLGPSHLAYLICDSARNLR